MENAFASQLLSDSPQALEGLPESLRMQLGPFNSQVQDSKTLSIQSLHASAFRLRYGSNYPRFPAHLIQHLQPQLFPTTVDQRLHFTPGAFRPFNVPTTPTKLFPSAFAPPLKTETTTHDSIQEVSPGPYVSPFYGSETEDDSNFRSNSEREIDFQCSEQQSSKLELSRSTSTSTPSPQSSSAKDEKGDGCNVKGPESIEIDNSESRVVRRGKLSMDPTSCPICGIMVLIGEAEAHFFKELEKLSHISAITRERKYLYDKYHDVQSCFNTSFTTVEENGHGTDSGIPRGRWETYQRIKSNRLSRLRIKNRKKKNGDPICPVCNEKIQGTVEDINLHVEHCLKKHSDEAEEDEEENIDVEGDTEVYGEYEWTGRHLIRATTFLVGGFAAGLLTTTSSSNHQPCEKEERMSNPEGEESACVTPIQLSDCDTNPVDEESNKERQSKNKEKNVTQSNESDYSKYPMIKTNNRMQ